MNMFHFIVLISWFLNGSLAATTGIEIGAPLLLKHLLRLEVAVTNMTWELASVKTSQVATSKKLQSTHDELQSTKQILKNKASRLQTLEESILHLENVTTSGIWTSKRTENTQPDYQTLPSTEPLCLGAAPYIRWGRKDCPSGRQLIYSGFAAGTHYSHKAGPANTLCLPKDPEYGKHTSNNHDRAYIYGSEYETINQLTGFNHLHDHDVPCAMCRTKQRRNTVMIPARKSCPKGWALEYTGYLMGGHYNHAASDYLCVDGKAQSLDKGHTSQDAHLLYLVEGVCGPLPCPPYKQYWELTCVVCSK